MKIKHNKISWKQIYWSLEFGISKQKISVDYLKKNLHLIDSPVFFLSTGRCGTQWFAELLKKDKSNKVFHAPEPDLGLQNVFVYKLWNNYKSHSAERESIEQIFLAGREDYLRYSYKTKKRYIETNNHITFFAPVIAEILPSAQFVHVIRHPAEFVRSGIRRNWYTEGKVNRQIFPVDFQFKKKWDKFSRLRKISWLWNETNEFIERFKGKVENERVYTFNFNELNENKILELCRFLNINVQGSSIKTMLKIKYNEQSKGSFPHYQNWSVKQKNELMKECKDLALKYAYKL